MKAVHILSFLLVNMVATALVSAKDDSVSNVPDKVTLDSKEALDFKKDRRWFWPDIDEECYRECCSREEVDEHFSTPNADIYWTNYQKWRETTHSHC